MAKNHITRAGKGAVWAGIRSANDQVGEAVAVDIAGRRDRSAAAVAVRHAAELEAVGPVQARQVDVRRKLRHDAPLASPTSAPDQPPQVTLGGGRVVCRALSPATLIRVRAIAFVQTESAGRPDRRPPRLSQDDEV